MAGTAFALQGPGQGDILGQGRIDSDPMRIFRLVRVIGGTHGQNNLNFLEVISKDSVMIWITGTSGSDGVTVGPSSRVSYDSRVAGILATNVRISQDDRSSPNWQYVTDDLGARNWGFLQTYGLAYVKIGAGVTAGDLLGTAFTTGDAAPWQPQFATSTTALADGANSIINPAQAGFFGFAMDSDNAATAGDRVRCFIIMD